MAITRQVLRNLCHALCSLKSSDIASVRHSFQRLVCNGSVAPYLFIASHVAENPVCRMGQLCGFIRQTGGFKLLRGIVSFSSMRVGSSE